MWKIKPPAVFPMEARYRPILESLVPRDPMTLFSLKRGSPEEEFPDLGRNSTWMGRILTLAMYRRQFHRCTDSGVTFDDVIRPGLEEPGDRSVGCAAGDAHSYILFCDFFDRIIEAFHEQKISNQTPESDFNYDNLKGGDDLDRSYAAGCEVSVVRAVEDFCFPSHCSRGERRQLLSLARTALQQLAEQLPGNLHSVEELNQDQQREVMLQPPSSSQLRTGVARDWPDARAVWVSKDGSLVVWVNLEDHLKLVSTRDDANVAEAFKCICINLLKLEEHYKKLRHPFIWKQQLGWVTSSPANVGTGLRTSVHLRLRHLPQHRRLQDVLKRLRIRMDKTDDTKLLSVLSRLISQTASSSQERLAATRGLTPHEISLSETWLDNNNRPDQAKESPALYRVSNAATFGLTEVELTQLVLDGVKLLIAMEKRLEGDGGIDDLVPTQK